MHCHNVNSGKSGGETLVFRPAAMRRALNIGPALLILCLFMASVLVAPLFGQISGQIFLPPTSTPTEFWNATPVVHLKSTGAPDLPAEEYQGIRMSGVAWYSIETTRGTYYWSGVDHYTAFNPSAEVAEGKSQEVHNHRGDFLYTFLEVPKWANAQTDSITAFSISSNVVTITATNSLIVANRVIISGLSIGTYLNGKVLIVDSQTPTQFTSHFAHPNVLLTSDSGTSTFAGTSYQAPTDISTIAPCQGVLLGTTTTDCRYKEFVTALMQHICPTSSTCKIRNFEAWNEFDGNGYWDDTYQHLATMSEDAARIVKSMCTNCRFGAGSVSGGGVGYSDTETNSRNAAEPHWTYYDEVLTRFLNDWKADRVADSGIPEPDFISWHPYSAYANLNHTQALTPQPMPEYSYSGNGLGAGGNTGSSVCTIANASRTKNKYCIDSILTQASTIAALTSNAMHGVQGKAVWVTEGGFNALASMTNTDNNDVYIAPKPACRGPYSPVCTADVIRSAFLARWLILLRSAGVARAYWYSWDEPCFGTLFGMDAAQDGKSIPCSLSYNPGGATLYSLYNTKTRAGNSWDQVQSWLNGATMPTGCAENTSTHIYSCTITRGNQAGYIGLIVWYTPWLETTNYTPPDGYTQYRKLDDPTPIPYFSGSVTLGAEPIIFEKMD